MLLDHEKIYHCRLGMNMKTGLETDTIPSLTLIKTFNALWELTSINLISLINQNEIIIWGYVDQDHTCWSQIYNLETVETLYQFDGDIYNVCYLSDACYILVLGHYGGECDGNYRVLENK